MLCTKCGQRLDACTCPDIDARLHTLAYAPDGAVAFRWCQRCDKHYARCRCVAPQWRVIVGGKVMSS